MKQSLQDAIREKELPDANYPDFQPGDRIEVTTRVEIGGEKRTRRFEGVCIARRGEGPDQTFKVRKISFGVGVERLFSLYSPLIESIEVLSKGKVRRSKLNYLEGRSAREARIEEQRADLEAINTSPGSPEDAGTAGMEETAGDAGSETTEETAEAEAGEETGDAAETGAGETSEDAEPEDSPEAGEHEEETSEDTGESPEDARAESDAESSQEEEDLPDEEEDASS